MFKPDWDKWRAAFRWMSNAEAQRLYDEYEGLSLFDMSEGVHRGRIPASSSKEAPYAQLRGTP